MKIFSRILSRKTLRASAVVAPELLRQAGLGDATALEAYVDPERQEIVIRRASVEKTRWPGVSKIIKKSGPKPFFSRAEKVSAGS